MTTLESDDDGWTTVNYKKVKKPPSETVVYCKACNGPFLFSVERQKIHMERGWAPPNMCVLCKKKRKKHIITTETKPVEK